jgi:hypothetical protein
LRQQRWASDFRLVLLIQACQHITHALPKSHLPSCSFIRSGGHLRLIIPKQSGLHPSPSSLVAFSGIGQSVTLEDESGGSYSYLLDPSRRWASRISVQPPWYTK